MVINATKAVIWSADVGRDELLFALATIRRMGGGLRYVKLDRLGLTKMGLKMIREVQGRGFSAFADAKLIEVPSKIDELVEQHLKYRPWMLNCMADICSTGFSDHEDPQKIEALKRFAGRCREVGTLPCAVTVLTSKSEEMVAREFNGRTPIEQVLVYVEMLLEFGFTDVVCSPLEVPAIRAESRFDGLMLNTPGIRLPESSSDDQARVDTPAGAITAGADRLVIGRDLTNGNLNENFARIAAHLAEAGV